MTSKRRPGLLPGVRSRHLETRRLRVHYLESGPDDGVPVVLVHGNLSSGRFFEHLMPRAPSRLRLIAPDMRGYGDTEHAPLNATRGMRDWADDIDALVDALRIERPVHLAGWSAGGAAVATYLLTVGPVASLTFVAPVSPYGWGGVHPGGRACFDDFAGSGAGAGTAAEFDARIEAGDRATESAASPRSILRAGFGPGFRAAPEREEILLDEVLKSRTGIDGHNGDVVPSPNWPGTAPGTHGLMNALSPKYCDWSAIVDVPVKPPVLWVHGGADTGCADNSAHEAGELGRLGRIPGWPGPAIYPPQPMVTQIRTVLERYRANGGRVRMEWFAASGHAPMIDAEERFARVFFEFLADSCPAAGERGGSDRV